MMMKKHYLIYKTINDLNGMYYIGKHATDNINDSYLGSGVYLVRAIEKYGKEHFHREILFDFSTEEEMDAKERELVDENLVKDKMCYNLMLGGEGGDTWSGTGRHHSEETRKKLSEHTKMQWTSEETRKKFRESVRKTYERKIKECPEQLRESYKRRGEKISRLLKNRSKTISDAHKKLISLGMKRYYDKVGRKSNRTYRIEFHCDKSKVCGKFTYVNNGIKEYRIYIEELEWFLSHGWNKGRSLSGYKTQEASDSASGRGKMIIHHKGLKEVRRINPGELQSYLDNGWERGYLNKRKFHD